VAKALNCSRLKWGLSNVVQQFEELEASVVERRRVGRDGIGPRLPSIVDRAPSRALPHQGQALELGLVAGHEDHQGTVAVS
jgi:hypothetical protein